MVPIYHREGENYTLNPIQVTCPGCQKLYFVRPEDLSPGEARFQCTSCSRMFAFNWPVPPDVTSVMARLLSQEELQGFPAANQTNTKAARPCPRCGVAVDSKFNECPKCGVLLDRAKKMKMIDPIAKGATPELAAAWDKVRENYADETLHEGFIQLCMAKENLAYASAQYRSILDANPSEDVANRMQNRIIELATFSYITSKAHEPKESKYPMISKIMMVNAGLLIVSGLALPAWRSMIAIGGSILVFVFTARFIGGRS